MSRSSVARVVTRALAAWIAVAALMASAAGATLNVGSKRFTESYILGEILAAQARRAG